MRLQDKLLKYLNKRLVNNLETQYKKKHQQDLPIILITGTAGKSSQTLILNQLFQSAGYKVYSGTTLNKNLNSLSGLGLVLLNKLISLEGKNQLQKFFDITTYYFQLFLAGFYLRFELPQKSILIYEVGYDHQGESVLFADLFSKIHTLICTNLTWEHSNGFMDEFQEQRFDLIKNWLPAELISKFHESSIPGRLKNIALEQLTLTNLADNLIVPTNIGEITNQMTVISKGQQPYNLSQRNIERNMAGGLVLDKDLEIGQNYLLPQSIAKIFTVAEYLSQQFKISIEKANEVFKNIQFPNGRFSLHKGIKNTTIVDSSYNSDPDSLKGFLICLEEMIQIQGNTDYLEKNGLVNPIKHNLILGEMRELGQISTASHKEILESVIHLETKYKYYLNEIILIGSEWLKLDEDDIPKSQSDYRIIRFHERLWKVFLKAGDINRYLDQDKIRPNDWFWIKGSQNTIFLELVVEYLLVDKTLVDNLCRRGKEWDKVRQKFL
jgi:UDP-N-acetylmuramyl pentapeptide synthase